MFDTLAALLPVLLTPLALAHPAPAPCFHLTDINYSSSEVYSTPAHLATYGGEIQFNLSNPAVPYVANCYARGMHLTDMFYGEFNYTCTPAGGVADAGQTNFTFSTPGGMFTVNQTYTVHHKKYLAEGAGSVKLDCHTDYWQNSNWTMGQLYSTTTTTCKPAELVIEPTVVPYAA